MSPVQLGRSILQAGMPGGCHVFALPGLFSTWWPEWCWSWNLTQTDTLTLHRVEHIFLTMGWVGQSCRPWKRQIRMKETMKMSHTVKSNLSTGLTWFWQDPVEDQSLQILENLQMSQALEGLQISLQFFPTIEFQILTLHSWFYRHFKNDDAYTWWLYFAASAWLPDKKKIIFLCRSSVSQEAVNAAWKRTTTLEQCRSQQRRTDER